MIPPAASAASQAIGSSNNGSYTFRRFPNSLVPPTWYTVGISTKEFLTFEVSMPSCFQQELIYKSLLDHGSLSIAN